MHNAPTPAISPSDARRWWSIGLLTRVAIAGGLLVPAGLVMMADGGDAVAQGILLAFAGVVVAMLAVRRVNRMLGVVDEPVPSTPEAPAFRLGKQLSPSRRPA